LRLTVEIYAEGDGGQQQSHRAALDRYALNRPQLRRADALRNVPMDVSASAQSNAATTTREAADPVSGGITLTGCTLSCEASHALGGEHYRAKAGRTEKELD